MAYLMIKVLTLTNDIGSFEQLGPERQTLYQILSLSSHVVQNTK